MIDKLHTNFDHLTFARRMLRGGSIAVLSTAMMAGVSMAQDVSTDDEDDTVVATGIRQSLENAQNIKRNADTFVDSITASDIGALPDRSVLEAIQRVPGVSISRFAAGDDPDHFSVEGSGVVIRGLDYVRSEFNGRDAFSANNGRSLGFQDVPPELVGGVDVFKNQTADMIEGGISGVVNLRTLVPFDKPGQVFSITAEATYTDLAEEISPSFSALYSNRWDTKQGEFGFLASGSFSNLKSRSDGFQLPALYPYGTEGFGVDVSPALANTFTPFGQNQFSQTDASANIAASPGGNVRTQLFDRDRIGLTLAGQWASNDGKSLATAQFIRSEASNNWNERVLQSEEDPNFRSNDIYALNGFTTAPFTSEGLLQTRDNTNRVPVSGGRFGSGILTSDAGGWDGRYGIRQTGITRASDTDTLTSDYSLNYKYTPNESWKFNFDAQYVDATTENSDISVFGATYLDIGLDVTDLDNPTIEYLVSQNPGNRSANLGFDSATGAFRDINDPRDTYLRAAMDHFEDSEGDELALRADVEHEFNSDGWFKSVRIGGRYAKRDQLTRWSEYNWGNLSEAWNGGEVTFDELPSDLTETFTFDNFARGSILQGTDSFLFPALSLATDYDALLALRTNPDLITSNNWNPAGLREDGIYLPSEISNTTEETLAVYARVDFGNEDFVSDGGISIDGNYGVRIVQTKVSAEGAAQFTAENGEACTGNGGNPYPGVVEQCAFLQQGSSDVTSESTETHALPSFNLKVGLNDDLILRFAASRALSRPDVGSLRAYRNTRGDFSVLRENTDGGAVTGARFNRFIQTGGNPDLKPVQSTNLDASLEYYFSDVGSFTASAFYKDLEDIIVGTNSGETGSQAFAASTSSGVPFEGAVNNGSGKVQGFELAYQQFYDFLPGFMSGFGIQANYTYVDQSAIPNGGVRSVGGTGVSDDQPRFVVTDLENLSKHTVNAVGLYENDKVEARLAYNWRSDFLLTTSDVITRLPVYNESTGQLDASFKYNITDQFQIGLQGVNLLSEITETTVQIDDSGQRYLRSLFENDRRVSLTGRYTF